MITNSFLLVVTVLYLIQISSLQINFSPTYGINYMHRGTGVKVTSRDSMSLATRFMLIAILFLLLPPMLCLREICLLLTKF